ncbi:MAG: hypothetical protein M1835_006931 [Candelina submexicana]|nr:MAG: hypothetical protein M1835_006931 [Candelina submexicana]
MRDTLVFTLALSLLSVATRAVQPAERDDSATVVALSTERKRVGNLVDHNRLRQRANTQPVAVPLDNAGSFYYVNISVGTPSQNQRVHLDTGSSDLWTSAATSQICKLRSRPCQDTGTYNANASSTYKYLNSGFNLTYIDGSGARGDNVIDIVRIGNVEIPGLQFGVGYKSNIPEGVLGVGYENSEAQVGHQGQRTYSNLPQLMVEGGLIQSNAYSLWLNDLEASTGSILFGGVDTNRFHGKLQTLPILTIDGVHAAFFIAMTSITLSNGRQQTSMFSSSNNAMAVLLDSGSSLTYLPDTIANAIFTQVGASYDERSQAAYIPCSMMNNASTLDYTFTSPVISVPMNELVIDLGTTANGRPLTFNDGTPACMFGIAPSGGSTNILGDTFLRSAYVVYDLNNNEISIAQTNFNATSDNVLPIGTGTKSVPSATAVANPATAVVGAVGGRAGSPTGSGTLVGTATATAGAVSTNVPLGIIAGAAGAGLLLVL